MQALIDIFKKRDAVKVGKFLLASGRESDLYVDARKVVLSTEGLKLIRDQIWRIAQREVLIFDHIGGKQSGADPIVAALLTKPHKTNDYLNGFLWRKEVKEHGTMQEYEGTILPNATILLIDDVATSGGSLLEVASKVRQLHSDIQIEAAIVVVDREEGAREALAAQGIPLFSCLTRSELVH
jgi:orotate phosphoribosyltransferase